MSIERELLKRIADSNYGDTIPAHFIYEIEKLLAQPEQPEQITFKDEADKIAFLEKSVELLVGLLDAKKYQPLTQAEGLKIFEESEYLWFLEYKIRELKMQKKHTALEVGKMSKERELLKRVLASSHLVTGLEKEIQQLLAQPEQEPLSGEFICEILLKKEWRGFVDLVRIIEKAHGIGGGENE